MEEGMGNKISCAAHECDILVDDQTVMSLINDPKVKLKYQHFITNSFVEVSSSACDSFHPSICLRRILFVPLHLKVQ
jgi:hypothetical protein